jgi:hypothetical protein
MKDAQKEDKQGKWTEMSFHVNIVKKRLSVEEILLINKLISKMNGDIPEDTDVLEDVKERWLMYASSSKYDFDDSDDLSLEDTFNLDDDEPFPEPKLASVSKYTKKKLTKPDEPKLKPIRRVARRMFPGANSLEDVNVLG